VHPIRRLPAARSLMLALAAATGTAQATPTVVGIWNEAALQEIRVGNPGPPVAARALAIAHTCMYDAWVPYDNRAVAAVATGLPRRPAAEALDANKAKAISHAAYQCLVNLFPAGSGRLQAVMRRLGHDPADVSTQTATPQGIGNSAAAAVIASRRHDGSNQYGDLAPGRYADYTGYAPANGPMPFCRPDVPGPCNLNVSNPLRWQPLINNLGVQQRFLSPHWERVTPFALTSADQFDTLPELIVGPNYLRNPAVFQTDIDFILRTAANLNAAQKLSIEYWADGPDSELPPGHWGLFAQAVALRDAHNIDKDVKMFFAMHNASFDAGIAAWHLKRKYDGVRPITGVRFFRAGQTVLSWGGPGRPVEPVDAGKWSPYNPGSNLTPSFPGWVSGHATYSAASAAVLRAYTGSDWFGFSTVVPAGFGRVEPAVPPVATELRYDTYTDAAREAAESRLWAGIHFNDDNQVGLLLGDAVGRQAWAKSQFLFDGGLTTTTASRANSPGAYSLNWQHTVDEAGNRLLLVGIATTDDSTSVRSLSYAGRALARLGAQNGPWGDNRVELWYLVAPPVGTATVSLQLANRNDVAAGAASFNGVDQLNPFGTLRAGQGTGTAACVTLANEAAPLVASVLVANGDAGSVAAPAGQSIRWQTISDLGGLIGPSDSIGTGMVGPGAPVGNVCQFLARGSRWGLLAVPLRPAVP